VSGSVARRQRRGQKSHVARALLQQGGTCWRCGDSFCPVHGSVAIGDRHDVSVWRVVCLPCFQDAPGTIALIAERGRA